MSKLSSAIRKWTRRDRRPSVEASLRAELRALRARCEPPGVQYHVPPGHYYSPIHSVEDVRQNHDAIFGPLPRSLPGIDFREEEQMDLFNEFLRYIPEAQLPLHKQEPLRYYTENNWYPYGDAVFLYCMIRHFRPRRIIEVGSGFSSCAILDTNELFFDNHIQCTFIEPEPQRLYRAIRPEDRDQINIVESPVQKVPVSHFQELEAGDILLIDSSHVSKINSDVNYLYFEVLPQLRPGVLVHVHDIFYPFRYPDKWIYKGWAWNEAYILRAFLTFNSEFKVRFCNTLWNEFYADRILASVPRAHRSGGSIWIQRV